MAATLHELLLEDGASPVPTLIPWARLVSGLSAIGAIIEIGVIVAGGSVDLWVVMADEDDAAEAEVSRLERDFRVAVGPAPFELHLAPLTMVDRANLPRFETVFSRQAT
jgi:hypothetical protein